MKTENRVAMHEWESWAGPAPYRFVTIITVPSKSLAEANPTAYNNAMAEASQVAKGFGVHLCSCYRCGHGLYNNCVCQNTNGEYFVVGIDCVRKCGDTKFVSQAEKAEKTRQKELRDERNRIKWEKQRQEREAKLQEQRDRNNGLTDYEVGEREQRREQEQRQEQYKADNEWLVTVLESTNYQSGGFVDSMIGELQRKRLSDFSPKCQSILCDIYAKQHGRRNSKAFSDAQDVFESKLS